MESEISRLKSEIASFKSDIVQLEKENYSLQTSFSHLSTQNLNLRTFKENLKKTLNSCQTTKSPSPVLYTPDKTIDGKEFFKEARLRLSYENFAIFLGYVKKLNDKLITKERALFELKDVFEEENEDLFEKFCALILRRV